MVTASIFRRRLGPGGRRVAGKLVLVAVAEVVVVIVRALLGVWAAAGLVAALVTAGLIAGWAAVEARAFPPPPTAGPRGPGPAQSDHVTFARALMAVTAAYLAHCERQEMGR